MIRRFRHIPHPAERIVSPANQTDTAEANTVSVEVVDQHVDTHRPTKRNMLKSRLAQFGALVFTGGLVAVGVGIGIQQANTMSEAEMRQHTDHEVMQSLEAQDTGRTLIVDGALVAVAGLALMSGVALSQMRDLSPHQSDQTA